MKLSLTKTIISLIAVASFVACAKNETSVADDAASVVINPFAKYRSYDDARAFAESALSLLGEDTKSPIRRIASGECVTNSITKSDNDRRDTLFYVFNYADNEGFAIINANPGMEPIIAVTEKGYYNDGESTGVPALDEYINVLKEKLLLRFDPPELYYWYDYITICETVNRNVGVRWGHRDIYGQYCPNGNAGCVATAMAQIMAYHLQPSSFIASVDMDNDYDIDDVVSLNWSAIKNHVHTHTLPQTCSSVHTNIGALLREIGEQVFMDYDDDGSYASVDDVPGAFFHFGYSTSSVLAVNNTMLKSALFNYGPVYMRGGGHAWVADGYKVYKYYYCRFERAVGDGSPVITEQTLISETYYTHINWGWDGDCNGYFGLGIYDIDDALSYDVSHYNTGDDYNSDVKMIIVYP